MAYTVDVDTSQVSGILSEVEGLFTTISDKFASFERIKGNIPGFWNAAEADTFLSKCDEVSTSYNEFKNEYDLFVAALNSYISSYDSFESEVVASIGGTGGN